MSNIKEPKWVAIKIVGSIVLFIGIIVAINSNSIDFLSTYILDIVTGEIPLGLGRPVLFVMIFILVSDILFFISNKNSASCIIPHEKLLSFHMIYAVAGLFFSFATACINRSMKLTNYYFSIMRRPDWYNEDIISAKNFGKIPEVGNDLLSAGYVFYALTSLCLIALVFMILSSKKTKNAIGTLIGKIANHYSTKQTDSESSVNVERKTNESFDYQPTSAERDDSEEHNETQTNSTDVLEDSDMVEPDQIVETEYATDSMEPVISKENKLFVESKETNIPYIDELKQLKQLVDLSIITQEEFEAKKKELLNL